MNNLSKTTITKGWLDISLLQKGYLPLSFKYEIKRRTGSGYNISSGYNEDNLIRDLRDVKPEDIDYIKVWVKWDKKYNTDKKISAIIVKNKIEAILLEKNNINYNKIIVELLDD